MPTADLFIFYFSGHLGWPPQAVSLVEEVDEGSLPGAVYNLILDQMRSVRFRALEMRNVRPGFAPPASGGVHHGFMVWEACETPDPTITLEHDCPRSGGVRSRSAQPEAPKRRREEEDSVCTRCPV